MHVASPRARNVAHRRARGETNVEARGRSATVHLKEHKGPGDFGQGECPWDQVFEICETTGGTEWYIVEQENYNKAPLDCVKQCLEFLRSKGKAKA